ncbi:MAG: penicillin-binding protein 1C [Cytophagales bacterium]
MQKILHFLKTKPKTTVCIFVSILCFILIPSPKFTNDYATLLLDQKGEFLNAKIAKDGQWRFAPIQEIPEKLEKCILTFEDKNFYYHPGIDLLALGRALIQNITHRRNVSGASTLSMQVVRISDGNTKRNLYHKLWEMIRAFKYDVLHSKKTIICTYVSQAPYGGNMVGVRAASWRYFGRDLDKLSWAEYALLAVLPNSPSKLHLGKNRIKLLLKRNRLLKKLYEQKSISKENYELALQESIPEKPQILPQLAPHLINKAIHDGHEGTVIQSSILYDYQQRLLQQVTSYSNRLQINGVNNAAAVIIDLQKSKILAYVGNTTDPKNLHQNYVDIVNAKRSYGSLLKPFLFAHMLNEGQITPQMLEADIPTNINGYAPENFDKSYEGSVPASTVIAHSLNVPSIRMLQEYGTEKFLLHLRKHGLQSLSKSGEYYGLSLILGGGDATMWELSSAYAKLAQELGCTNGASEQISYINTTKSKKIANFELSKPALWYTAEAIAESKRPGEHGEWQYFESAQKIAWKTGTSYGLRDAWCIGYNKNHLVAVWFGNADGEGRAGLTGIGVAAPFMFEVFNTLPHSPWFSIPESSMKPFYVCKTSGHKASEICPDKVYQLLPNNCEKTRICPYHKKIFVDASEKHRVHADCEPATSRKEKIYFVLPPVEESYYKLNNITYKTLPEYRKDCMGILEQESPLKIIYPNQGAKLSIPKTLGGEKSKVVFKAAHRKTNSKIFWHIDEHYLGETQTFHKIEAQTDVGIHTLTIVDEQGNSHKVKFEIIGK